jgi:hypothetical protein
MKKILATALLFLTLAPCAALHAAGTFTITSATASQLVGGEQRIVIRAAFIADASDGSVPPLAIPVLAGNPTPLNMYLLCVKTLAGATAPTSGWSIRVTDGMKVDLLTGNGTGQSTSGGTGVATMPSAGVPVTSDLTVAISGNSVNSATGTVELDFTSN